MFAKISNDEKTLKEIEKKENLMKLQNDAILLRDEQQKSQEIEKHINENINNSISYFWYESMLKIIDEEKIPCVGLITDKGMIIFDKNKEDNIKLFTEFEKGDKKIFVCMNIGGGHWVGGYFEGNSLTYMNPFGADKSSYPQAQKMIQRFHYMYEKIFESKKFTKNIEIKYDNRCRQNDGYNCGPITLYWMKLDGHDDKVNYSNDIKKIRKNFVETLKGNYNLVNKDEEKKIIHEEVFNKDQGIHDDNKTKTTVQKQKLSKRKQPIQKSKCNIF